MDPVNDDVMKDDEEVVEGDVDLAALEDDDDVVDGDDMGDEVASI